MDNQKLNQINNRVAIIGALIFLVYCVALFLFSGIFTSTAAVSLVFVVIAFLATFAIPRVAIKHPDVEAVFFGIPMMGFAVYYFFAEIFVSAVFIAFQEHISFKIALFIQLIILVAFVIISIVSFTAQSSIAQRSEDRKQQVAMRGIQQIDIQSIVETVRLGVNDPTLVSELEHLADTVRYSDPFAGHNPAIEQMEMIISGKVMDLRAACEAQDVAAARQLVREVEALYRERSAKLLLLK